MKILFCLAVLGMVVASRPTVQVDPWKRDQASFKSNSKYADYKTSIERLDTEALSKYISRTRKEYASKSLTAQQKQIKAFEIVCGEVVRLGKDGTFIKWVSKDYKYLSALFQEASTAPSLETTYVGFILGTFIDAPLPSTAIVGEKLIQHYSSDIFLMYALIPCYQPQAKDQDEDSGRKLIERMKEIDPDNLRTIRGEGIFYYLLHFRTREKRHRDIALERFQKALKMLPPDSEAYKLVKSQVAELLSR